ncbi:MAG TPA: hypothetical protein PKO45_13040 [Rubrivivax sp.]|nr:hypothetical protein [Rubrivivax sp.]
MAATKFVNGELLSMTPQEEADFEAARAPRLEDVQAQAHARVDEVRAKVEAAGVTTGAKGQRIDTSAAGLARLALLAAGDDGQGDVSRPSAEVLKAAAVRVDACAARAAALHSQVDAAKDAREVFAIDIDAGWPA